MKQSTNRSIMYALAVPFAIVYSILGCRKPGNPELIETASHARPSKFTSTNDMWRSIGIVEQLIREYVYDHREFPSSYSQLLPRIRELKVSSRPKADWNFDWKIEERRLSENRHSGLVIWGKIVCKSPRDGSLEETLEVELNPRVLDWIPFTRLSVDGLNYNLADDEENVADCLAQMIFERHHETGAWPSGLSELAQHHYFKEWKHAKSSNGMTFVVDKATQIVKVHAKNSKRAFAFPLSGPDGLKSPYVTK